MHIMSSLASPSSIVDCLLVLGSCCNSRSTGVGPPTSTGLAAWWLAERNVSLFYRHLCRANSNRWQNGRGYPVYIMSVLPSKCKDNIKTSIHKHQTHTRTRAHTHTHANSPWRHLPKHLPCLSESFSFKDWFSTSGSTYYPL